MHVKHGNTSANAIADLAGVFIRYGGTLDVQQGLVTLTSQDKLLGSYTSDDLSNAQHFNEFARFARVVALLHMRNNVIIPREDLYRLTRSERVLDLNQMPRTRTEIIKLAVELYSGLEINWPAGLNPEDDEARGYVIADIAKKVAETSTGAPY